MPSDARQKMLTPSAMAGFFVGCATEGNTSDNQFKARTNEAQILLLLLSELFFALRANDPETFKRCVHLIKLSLNTYRLLHASVLS